MREQRVRATPHDLRCVLEKLRSEDEQHKVSLSRADLSEEFVRDVSYFINSHHPEEGNA